MQGFLVALLICSVTMSGIALLYIALSSALSKRYTEKGRYYIWLLIVIGFIVPFRPQWSNAVVSVDLFQTQSISPIAFQMLETQIYTLPTDFAMSFTMVPEVYVLPANNAAVTATTTNITRAWAWWQLGFAVWLAGVLLFVFYQCVKHYRYVKMERRWRNPVTNEKQLILLHSLKSNMKIKRHIPVYTCSFVGSPVLLGLLSPRILLPATDYSQDELYFIFKHELVHYKRKDIVFKYLVLVSMALHWFNPVVYVMAKAVNRLCETSCDAEVLKNADTNMRQLYGEIIINIAQYKSNFTPVLSTSLYGGKHNMTKRILSVMDTRKKKMGISIACIVLLFMAAAGWLFAVQAGHTDDPVYNTTPEVYNADEQHDELTGMAATVELISFQAVVVKLEPNLFTRNHIPKIFVNSVTSVMGRPVGGNYFFVGEEIIGGENRIAVLNTLGDAIDVSDIRPGALLEIWAYSLVADISPAYIPGIVSIQVIDPYYVPNQPEGEAVMLPPMVDILRAADYRRSLNPAYAHLAESVPEISVHLVDTRLDAPVRYTRSDISEEAMFYRYADYYHFWEQVGVYIRKWWRFVGIEYQLYN